MLLVLGCRTAPPAPPPDLPTDAPPAPELVREADVVPPLEASPVTFGLGPEPSFVTRSIGDAGGLLWFGPNRETLFFSRSGDGPGEVRDGPFITIDATGPALYDMGPSRLTWWDTTGALIRHTPVRSAGLFSGPGREGEWLAMRIDENGLVPIAVDVESGRERRLLTAADSFARAELGGTLEDERRLSSIGRWDSGFLIANGRSYRIGGYDWEGRLRFVIAPELPPKLPSDARVEELMASRPMDGPATRRSPEQWRERFRTSPEQWFSHLTPPRTDSAGRIWVVVRAHGELFAEAWWLDRPMGRFPLECPGFPGRWKVAGSYLAIPCRNEAEEGVTDWIYHVWRIEDLG
jgi:hypothetical protein